MDRSNVDGGTELLKGAEEKLYTIDEPLSALAIARLGFERHRPLPGELSLEFYDWQRGLRLEKGSQSRMTQTTILGHFRMK